MQLILAIDSDPRQSAQLASLVRHRLKVDLVQATSAGEGLQSLGERVPDLILTSPLLSPFDDGVLDEYLRDLGAAATHVQTLRIPVLSAATKKSSAAKRLFSLGRKKQTSAAAPDGCDPKLFADEIALYLERAAEDRRASASRAAVPALVRDVELLSAVEPEPEYTPAYEYAAEPEFTTRAITEPEYVAAPEPTDLFVTATEEPMPAVASAPGVVAAASEPVAPVVVKPAPSPVVEPRPADSTDKLTTPSFEAALAAIRAAWGKPATEGAVAPAPAAPPAARGPLPKSAAQVEVDLTNAIDHLDDAIDSGDETPSADQDPTGDDSKTPSARRKIDKSKKRPEKPRGRKARGAQDEWGIFDPNQCNFTALVNKLDEVTDDELTPGMIATARIITAG